MQEIHSYSQLQEALKQKLQVVFFSSHACSVCTVDLPEVEKICDRYQVPLLQVKVEEVPEAAGQNNVFSLPAVLVFYKSREIDRQARFIDFERLKHCLQQYQNIQNPSSF